MKSRTFKSAIMLTAVLATAAVFSACKNNGNEPANIDLPAQFANVEIADTGGSQTITFSATADWTVTVKYETQGSEWLAVSPTSGKAGSNISLTLTVQPNTTDVERSATVTITAAEAQKSFTVTQAASNATAEAGVLINGVVWATRNVDEFRTFVKKPEDAGMFYQWNRPTAWPATGDVTGWDTTASPDSIWEPENDPCPDGWRVPTDKELSGLANNTMTTWSKLNGVTGMYFSSDNTVFLPAAGRRLSDGSLDNVGIYGSYWSSTVNSNPFANAILFSGLIGANSSISDEQRGFSIRCVKK